MVRLVHLLPVFASAVILVILSMTAISVDRAECLVTAAPWAVTLVAYLAVGRRGSTKS